MTELELYDAEYDDHDKYFDYIYDLYTEIHQHVQSAGMLLLDQDYFPHFFRFCLKHLNRPVVDKDIKALLAQSLKEDK